MTNMINTTTRNTRKRSILSVVGWVAFSTSTTAVSAWAPTTSSAIVGRRPTRTTTATTTPTRTSLNLVESLASMEEAASSMSLASSSAMATIDSFWQTSPYTAAAVACGFKASAADMVAQRKQNNAAVLELEASTTPAPAASFLPFAPSSTETTTTETTSSTTATTTTDYRRNAAFLLYGSLYQGISQEYIYNHLYPVWFGNGQDIPTVLTKVGFDLSCQTTLVTLPVAYLIKGVLFGDTPRQALDKYVRDIQNQQLLQKYFLLWGPVQCLTFGVVPEHLRVTFIACVSFFWLIILSQLSSESASNSSSNSSSGKETV